MLKAIRKLFECHHPNYTFPQTDRNTGETTVACLDCGKRLSYDFDRMQVAA